MGKPGKPTTYVSDSGMFEINIRDRQLVIKSVSLPNLQAKRKKFFDTHKSLFSESPKSWEECLALIERAEQQYKEWIKNQ